MHRNSAATAGNGVKRGGGRKVRRLSSSWFDFVVYTCAPPVSLGGAFFTFIFAGANDEKVFFVNRCLGGGIGGWGG